jgi:hypothetical protein
MPNAVILKNLPVKRLCGSCFIVLGPEFQSPPPPYTLYTCKQYAYSQRAGGGELAREKVRGAIVHKPVENTNMTDCISSL